MSYLEGRVLFPEKLKKAQEILAPFFSAEKVAAQTPSDPDLK